MSKYVGDYGDITGVQVLRRFISDINGHFGKLNVTVNEVIRVVNDLSDIVNEIDVDEAVIKDIENIKKKLSTIDERVDKIDTTLIATSESVDLFNKEITALLDGDFKDKSEQLQKYINTLKEMPKLSGVIDNEKS